MIRLAALFASLLWLTACQTASVPPAAMAPAPIAAATTAPAVAGIGALLTAARQGQGKSAVSENPRLSAAAQAHAEDMVRNGYFSHTGKNGSTFSQRARAAGYGCPIAENIASGQRSEAEVMQVWMGSEGHRRNILLPNDREYGIGRSGNIWVLMFGTGC